MREISVFFFFFSPYYPVSRDGIVKWYSFLPDV